MKKSIVQLAFLLIGNIVLGLLVSIAFLVALMRDDLVMAAIPALLALPGLLLQPWYVLFLLLPYLNTLSPVFASITTFFVYRALARRPAFRRLFRRRPKLSLAQILVRSITLFVTGAGLMFARYKDFPALRAGPPSSVRQSIEAIEPLQSFRGQFYQLSSFLDQEALWQAKLTPDQTQQLVKTLGLSTIPAEQFPAEFSRMPPYWWHPQKNSTTQYYSTPEFPIQERGPDGPHAIALWNPGDQLFYLWIKNNF